MYSKLQRQAYEANMLLKESGLIELTFGNASVIDRKAGVIAIKPSGVSYEKLTPRHMVLVNLDGKKVGGPLNPSSDTPTHVRLYRAFQTIGAVVHTHSPAATAFAQARLPIPCLGTTHADYFNGPIPVTRTMTARDIGGAYEWETGNVIVERFRRLNPEQFPGVLVACHGPFAWGQSGEKAVEHAFAMELCGRMAFETLALNPRIRPISRRLLAKHFFRKHGKNAYYGQRQ